VPIRVGIKILYDGSKVPKLPSWSDRAVGPEQFKGKQNEGKIYADGEAHRTAHRRPTGSNFSEQHNGGQQGYKFICISILHPIVGISARRMIRQNESCYTEV
jgi:hypothetical protein